MLDLYRVAAGHAVRIGAIALSIGLAGWMGYSAGTSKTTRVYEARLARQDADHANVLRVAAEAATDTLGKALVTQQFYASEAHRVGLQLLNTQAALAKTKELLYAQIDRAVQQDGPRFTGLGPDSLRVYRAHLGYAAASADTGAAADAGDADQASQAASADQGLPPADLLAHAADYGEWCQRLEARVDAYIQLHQGAGLQ
ncbi:hypothetical protein R0381_003633 [Jeongeupia wiesaeckerbachi]|uniref:hypothetical protein n=1 Tax=Jeongeupia wiesaeckerbachi TaxID=3051218 RepID=UPI003D805B18